MITRTNGQVRHIYANKVLGSIKNEIDTIDFFLTPYGQTEVIKKHAEHRGNKEDGFLLQKTSSLSYAYSTYPA